MGKATSTTNAISERRQLRAELRRLRQDRGLTQEEVAGHLDWSVSKLVRIEGGQVGIVKSDLDALLQLYGVENAAGVERLHAMARAARQPSWWNQYRDVLSRQDAEFLGHEAAAVFIRMFEPLIIPPLLQTEEYARALLTHGYRFAPAEVERRIQLQQLRQEQLDRDPPPRLYFVLDEGAVRRLVGGPSTMRDQLSWLITMADRDLVTVRVMPLVAGATPAVLGAFTTLEFEGVGDLLLLGGTLLDENDPRVAEYSDSFEELLEFALVANQSIVFLQQLIDELAGQGEQPEALAELEQYFVL